MTIYNNDNNSNIFDDEIIEEEEEVIEYYDGPYCKICKSQPPNPLLGICSTNCIDFLGNQTLKSSFHPLTIQRRILNQSRASSGRFIDNLSSVIVASDFLNTNSTTKFNTLQSSSNIWGTTFYLRNQSDQVQPSNYKILPENRYINTPSRGNSVKTTVTRNIPGGSTPGGFGVDVKHGSYQRYLDKKKGLIVSKSRPPDEETLLWYRENPLSLSCYNDKPQTCGYKGKPNSSGINNQPFKFSLVSLNNKLCKTC